jgi:hypothetical protein
MPWLAEKLPVRLPPKKKFKHFAILVRATVRMKRGVAEWRKQTHVRDLLATQIKKQREEEAIKNSEAMKLTEKSKAEVDKVIEASKAARAEMVKFNPMKTPARRRSTSRERVPHSAPGASSTSTITHPRVETLKRKSRKSTSGHL